MKFSSATEEAYKYILQNIRNGSYKAGHYIVEKEITEYLGLSRTPYREATVRLITENYLVKKGNNRIQVAPVSKKELNEIYKVRCFLEERILNELEKICEDRHIKEMNRIVSYLSIATQNRDISEILRLMDEFHNYLASLLNNSTLMGIMQIVNGQISRYRSLLIEDISDKDITAINESHQAIYQSIRKKDFIEAKERIVSWNITSNKFLTKMLKNNDFFD